jgi:hypothetical protein
MPLIFFGDEASIRSDYHAGTTWGAIGRTPVVRATGWRVSCNMVRSAVLSAAIPLRDVVIEEIEYVGPGPDDAPLPFIDDPPEFDGDPQIGCELAERGE